LLAKPRLASLGPGVQEADVQAKLNRFDPQVAFGQPVRDLDAARACLAALWLYFDYLDESHGISQDLNTPEGSCWHAIMHRREPDAWNSRYWWRQVWNHPVITQLISEAPTLGYDYTTPADFVDFCERVRGSGRNDETLAKQVQLLEWQILFDFCARKAVG
jgi:hypothetical protein